MDKPYKMGLLVGRFQTLHIGHAQMVDTAIALCERVVILVGSAQESGTEKNPFSYELREQALHAVFGDAVEIYPLQDIGVGNNCRWGEYVLQQVVDKTGAYPNLLVSGKESRRVDWFDGITGADIAELYIPKSISISASEMRTFLIYNDMEQWKRYTCPQLWAYYSVLREAVLNAQGNRNTQSV